MKPPIALLIVVILCTISTNIFANANDIHLPQKPVSAIKMLSSYLVTAGGSLADGNRVVFSSEYSNGVDGNDAIKIINSGENFGLVRDFAYLAIEARQPIAAGDTLFYKMTNLINQQYKLIIIPENLGATVIQCGLYDRYLNTQTVISLADTNRLNIEVNADPASKAYNRLSIVFYSTSTPLPLRFTDIFALAENEKNIGVNWSVEQELNVDHYEVERSENGVDFNKMSIQLPVFRNNGSNTYHFVDPQPLSMNHFYRIKSVDISGKNVFSKIVKAAIRKLDADWKVYPNPVTGNLLQLQFENFEKGVYKIILTNIMGQIKYVDKVLLSADFFIHSIKLGNNMAKGNYQLTVLDVNGKATVRKIVLQ